MKLKEAIVRYQNSSRWAKLSPRSKAIYQSGIRYLIELYDQDIKKITRPVVIRHIENTIILSPSLSEISLKVMRQVFNYAYDNGWVDANPCGKGDFFPKAKPYERWTDTEVDLFINTAPRHLARAVRLALYTGQRRGDLIRMTWDDYDGACIHVIQQKTGKELYVPVHPELKKELDRPERNGPYLIWNAYGRKWQAAALTEAVQKHLKEIGIKDRVLHGIRKTTASKLAELGCSPHEIASITGQSLKEVEHYTKGVMQKRMAENAMRLWSEKEKIE